VAKKKESVDAFMARLEHPLKAEVQMLREIIKGVDPRIGEEIKWNAPSYHTTDYLVTFNLRATEHVHLVFHNPHIATIQSPLLHGDYADRRMAYFADMAAIERDRAALESVIRQLVALTDAG
jgi:hypothetical protein